MKDDEHRPAHRAAPRIVIVGAGFTGLAAGYELAKRNLCPTIIEAENEVGGLARSFTVGDTRLERFYHHWFTSDRHLMEIAEELGVSDSLVRTPTRTGVYYSGSLFRLSSPLDVLRFKPLSLAGRLRLAMLVPAARAIGYWQALDDVPAALWLRHICGEEVYRVVWEPLLRGKFGKHAETISAAWFWSKLRLRGGSRGRRGQEQLVYFKGGFAALAEKMVSRIKTAGGRVIVGSRVERLAASNGRITRAVTEDASYAADAAIITTPLPVAASLLSGLVPDRYVADIGRISYLVNRCLVFELDRSLSELYWINVNDPSFPFVGVVEHTNLIDAADYAKRHIIYLSRYCPPDDAFLSLSTQDAVAFAVPHLQRMFPKFDPNMILKTHSWQAEWAQPLVVAGYGKLIPGYETPLAGVYLATMAQVYPEDRGTNYAIREGRKVAGLLAKSFR